MRADLAARPTWASRSSQHVRVYLSRTRDPERPLSPTSPRSLNLNPSSMFLDMSLHTTDREKKARQLAEAEATDGTAPSQRPELPSRREVELEQKLERERREAHRLAVRAALEKELFGSPGSSSPPDAASSPVSPGAEIIADLHRQRVIKLLKGGLAGGDA